MNGRIFVFVGHCLKLYLSHCKPKVSKLNRKYSFKLSAIRGWSCRGLNPETYAKARAETLSNSRARHLYESDKTVQSVGSAGEKVKTDSDLDVSGMSQDNVETEVPQSVCRSERKTSARGVDNKQGSKQTTRVQTKTV